MKSHFHKAPLKKPRPYKAMVKSEWPSLAHLTAPLICELGCGTGEWSVAQALKNPSIHYVAIEKTRIRSEKLLRHAQGLKNITAIRADAIAFLQSCPEGRLDEILILHPNPWPPLKLANRRFCVGSAFWVLDRCLKVEGTLTVASNTLAYIEEVEVFLREVWNYRIMECLALPTTHIPRTAFERKYMKRGEVIYQIRAQKSAVGLANLEGLMPANH